MSNPYWSMLMDFSMEWLLFFAKGIFSCATWCLSWPIGLAYFLARWLFQYLFGRDFAPGEPKLVAIVLRWLFCALLLATVWGSYSWWSGDYRKLAFDFGKNRDEVITRATQLLGQVHVTRDGVKTTHERLMALVTNVSLSAPTQNRAYQSPHDFTLKDMLKTVNALIDEGQVALDLHMKLLDSVRAYSGVLPAAKVVCLEAATHQRELAAAEEYAELKQTYLAAAVFFERHAEEIGRSATAVVQPQEEVLQSADYVQHAMQFLHSFRDDLETVPEFPGPEMQADMMRAIQRFVKDFEKLRATLDAFGKAIPTENFPQPRPRGNSVT